MSRHTSNNQGFALMLVIWVLLAMSIVGSSLVSMAQTEIRSGEWLRDRHRLETASEAAALQAMEQIAYRADDLPSGQSPGKSKTEWLNIPVEISITGEHGRIDLNQAPREILLKLMLSLVPPGKAYALTDTLIDWRDADDHPGPNGAEATQYRDAGLSSLPANAPLRSIDELFQIRGFDQTLVERLSPLVTVYNRRPRVQPALAPLAVLKALPGVTAENASRFQQLLENGGEPDFTVLQAGPRYIDAQLKEDTFRIDIRVLDQGIPFHQQWIVRSPPHTHLTRLLYRSQLLPERTS